MVIRNIQKAFYRLVYGISVGGGGTHFPKTGKGKYVSVYKKGVYTDIVDEGDGHIYRLIPYQPNHGVFIEVLNNKNKVIARRHFSTTEMKKYMRLAEEAR